MKERDLWEAEWSIGTREDDGVKITKIYICMTLLGNKTVEIIMTFSYKKLQ